MSNMSDLDAIRQLAAEIREPHPIDAAVARLRSPAVTTGATPIPPELAGALADLLAYAGEDGIPNTERVARAVLGWG